MAKSVKTQNEEILSELRMGINEKLEYLFELLNNHYQNDPSFYLQRHEFTFLANLIIKDNLYTSDSPIFMYNGKRFECNNFNILKHGDNLLSMNWQFVFYDVIRNNAGALCIIAKILTEDLIDD